MKNKNSDMLSRITRKSKKLSNLKFKLWWTKNYTKNETEAVLEVKDGKDPLTKHIDKKEEN